MLPLEGAASYLSSFPSWFQGAVRAVPADTPLMLLMAPGMAVFLVGYYTARHGRRHLAAIRRAGDARAATDAILYLRPFAADESPLRFANVAAVLSVPFSRRAWTYWWIVAHGVSRYEELLAFAFGRAGTFVAVGDPRERLPQLGAARVYAGDAEGGWKAEVGGQIAGARLVLLHVGSSKGLRWEVEKVVGSADPRRVVLCVNPPGKPKVRVRANDRAFLGGLQDAWNEFTDACADAFPRGLPECIGDARFVRFDAEWTAMPVQPPRVGFLPIPRRGDPDLSRRTVESALAWLSWVLVP